MKKCIFHVPVYIDMSRSSGSNIRPIKMIEGFKNIGYDVDIVMGYGKDRKKAIQEIKNNIKRGIKYDFLYSESSTMPTLLTEKNHLPKYPFLDFSFFKFCRKNQIKIGLFYRDIYWKFDEYKKSVSRAKRFFSVKMYKYDLMKYSKLLDVLYLPSIRMLKVIPQINIKKDNIISLPPGLENNYIKRIYNKKLDKINIFYVGGISKKDGLYDLRKLMSVASLDNNIFITICCRKEEWEICKSDYNELLNDQISVIHKSGNQLFEYFKNADLCSLYFPDNLYRSFAMPVKLFEYISYGIPVFASKGTSASDFIENNDIGFVINCSENDLHDLLKSIRINYDILNQKKKNIYNILKDNTWIARAKKVATDLNRGEK